MNTPTAPEAVVATGDRTASVTRNTAETKITVSVNLDGSGRAKLSTGTLSSTLWIVCPSGVKFAPRTQWPSASTSQIVYCAPALSGRRLWNTTNGLSSGLPGANSVPPEPCH